MVPLCFGQSAANPWASYELLFSIDYYDVPQFWCSLRNRTEDAACRSFIALSETRPKPQDLKDIYGKVQLTHMKTLGTLCCWQSTADQCEAVLNPLESSV